ncbi:MAG: hypothetical protein OXH12_09455 [Chloroflexi bacterium]|nr:hypothetical protein [Chloroflexota bacterium]MCY3603291.1 hypothetical protein [Chloroflexota bacterium]
MPAYTFLGTVLRARSPITLARVHEGNLNPIGLTCVTTDGTLRFDASIRVVASHVEVVVHNAYGDEPATVGNYVDRVVRSLLDAHGYVQGEAYELHIGQYIDHGKLESDEGWVKPFTVGALGVGKTVGTTFNDLVDLVILQDPAALADQDVARASACLSQALGDIREAIRNPHDTAVFCFRATEDIRRYYADDADTSPRPSWTRMGRALRIEQSFTAEVASARKRQAHGEGQTLSGEQRTEFVSRARAVVDRFVVSARTGLCELSEDFEILK